MKSQKSNLIFLPKVYPLANRIEADLIKAKIDVAVILALIKAEDEKEAKENKFKKVINLKRIKKAKGRVL